MKHTRLPLSFLPLAPLMILAAPLRAEGVQWQRLCDATLGREVHVATKTGARYDGGCLSTSDTELRVQTRDHGLVNIARQELASIAARRPRRHQVANLGARMEAFLGEGVKLLFSPAAPIGAAELSGTIAWGAIATPFCALADIASFFDDTEIIKPI